MRDSAPCLTSTHAAFAGLAAAGFDGARIDAVLRFYDERHRHYHDRAHLREMLDVAVTAAVTPTPAQVLAILMHDAIYVPGAPRGTNEAMSAQLLRVYATGLDRRLVEVAAGIVLDTAEHVPHHAEAPLVLDLDLLRLAVPLPDFDRHSRQVFAEQRGLMTVDDEKAAWRLFETRRAPFFRQLLARPAIYATAAIRDRYEAAARSNLGTALARSAPPAAVPARAAPA